MVQTLHTKYTHCFQRTYLYTWKVINTIITPFSYYRSWASVVMNDALSMISFHHWLSTLLLECCLLYRTESIDICDRTLRKYHYVYKKKYFKRIYNVFKVKCPCVVTSSFPALPLALFSLAENVSTRWHGNCTKYS